jgi:putative FmdB family regulatory protein
MPIYEYRCTSCGHELEALQKISEPVLTTCPSCRSESLAKQVSAAGFQLKGSGWYATDFRNSGKPAAKTASGDAKAGDAKAGDAKAGDTAANGSASGESKGGGDKGEAKSETKAASSAGGSGAGCACH